MVDLSKTVSIIFQGTDDVSGTIDKIGKNIQSFGDDITDIGQPFADATEQVLILDAAIIALAIAGLKASSDIEVQANKMANSLGLLPDEAQRFQDIAQEVYSAGFGDDLIQAFDAVTLAQKKFGDNAEVDIGKVTEQAFRLQSVFGIGFNESLGAVNTLMKNFGLSSTESFDFIAKGFQEGLDGSGDFIESINEYSTQFKNGGADAGQFFSVLSSGFQEGMLGTDRAADLFKEFRVRIQDGSKTTREALESIGLDPATFEANLASGTTTAVQAFDIIQEALNNTTDKTVQLNAGVGLMGTQFEDLGTEAALAVDTTSASIAELQGTIDDFDADTFEKKLVSAIRTAQTEFGNLAGWDEAKQKIGVILDDIAASFGPALDGVDFSALEAQIEELWNGIRDVFVDTGFDFTTIEGAEAAIQTLIDTVKTLATVTDGIVETLKPLAVFAAGAIKQFNDLDDSTKKIIGSILGLGTALATAGGVISGAGVLVSAIAKVTALFSSTGLLATGVSGIIAILTGPVGLAVALAAVAAATVGFTSSRIAEEAAIAEEAYKRQTKALNDLLAELDKVPLTRTSEVFVLIDSGDLVGAKKLIDEITDEEKQIKIDTEKASKDLDVLTAQINGVPKEKQTEYFLAIDEGDWARALELSEALPDNKNIIVSADIDDASIEAATKELEFFVDGERFTIEVPVDVEGVDEAKAKIEEIPTEKVIELKVQGDIDIQLARIAAQADVLQTAFEWDAKVDIAGAQASADILVAAFESAGESVSSLADSTSDQFGSLTDNWEKLSGFDKNVLSREVEKSRELTDKALESQIKLNDATVANIEAKTAASERGDAAIQITVAPGDLEPALNMIWHQVVQKSQIETTAEGADALLGL